ncbi:hypothetical protein TgHK011_002650 [Trichoderma gracile]|nr:hypothetical protein TgHK011_002650 [Trichoderma gracile]
MPRPLSPSWHVAQHLLDVGAQACPSSCQRPPSSIASARFNLLLPSDRSACLHACAALLLLGQRHCHGKTASSSHSVSLPARLEPPTRPSPRAVTRAENNDPEIVSTVTAELNGYRHPPVCQ